MEIPCKLVAKYYDYTYRLWNRGTEPIMLLFLIMFYRNGLMNYQSLLGHFKLLRAGSLDRRVGTYHCKINGRWYTDMPIYLIFEEIAYEKKLDQQKIPFEDFVGLINLYLNKPRNYCLDYIYYEFVEPFFKDDVIFDFELVNSDIIPDYETYYPGGYCCENCDGPLCDYKDMKYEWLRESALKKIEAIFKDYFKSKRK